MFKKFSAVFIIVILLTSLSLVCLAAGDALIKITRPDGNETTFKKSYVICGNTKQEDVTVGFERYDETSGQYVALQTEEGEACFKIGDSGFFMKEVKLNDGANKIKVYAYEGNDADNKQFINEFTITVLEESIKDKIKGGLLKFTDIFKSLPSK